MFACLLSVYQFVAVLFLFWPGSGNLAGAVEDGRSAGTGERDGERSEGGDRRIGALQGDYDSGIVLKLARSRRRTTPDIYSIIFPFCHIFRRSSSLAGYSSKSLTLLSIFVTRLNSG
jgi:hypothetical protein